MQITRAERGFLLLADSSTAAPRDTSRWPACGSGSPGTQERRHGQRAWHLRRDRAPRPRDGRGRLDGPSLEEAAERETVDGQGDDDTGPVQTVVCLPLRSPRSGANGTGAFPRAPAFSTSTTPAPPSPSAGRPARRRGARPTRGPRHRERPALRAGAAHDRGAAKGPAHRMDGLDAADRDLLRDAGADARRHDVAWRSPIPKPNASACCAFPTTRRIQLCISLVLAAVIHLLWIAFVGTNPIATLPIGEGVEISSLWLATVISLLSAVAIFRTV